MGASGRKKEKRESILQVAMELFSRHGYHKVTIPDIARQLKMSVGNFYNYFPSKEILAQEIIRYTTQLLGAQIRAVNEMEISTYEKIRRIVTIYFTIAQEQPEAIEYFLRVYLSNREVFGGECSGMVCVSDFVTEIMIFFDDGVAAGDLRDQDFFSAFGLFMGYLGGMVFLKGESMLPQALDHYTDAIAENIYRALKNT